MSNKGSPTIWGMIHLPALPGSPNNKLSMIDIKKHVLRDTSSYYEGGITHLVIENFGDVPFYKNRVPPHTISFMTALGFEITDRYPDVQLGINVLRNDGFSALAIAKTLENNAKFIRINILSGSYLTDQGIIEGEAAELLRYRSLIKADHIQIWADIDVKHATPFVNRPLIQLAEEVLERGGGSKVIVTGSSTGSEVDLDVLRELTRKLSPEYVVIGSGVKPTNIDQYKNFAQNFIVGTSLKIDNLVKNPVDKEKVKKIVEKLS